MFKDLSNTDELDQKSKREYQQWRFLSLVTNAIIFSILISIWIQFVFYMKAVLDNDWSKVWLFMLFDSLFAFWIVIIFVLFTVALAIRLVYISLSNNAYFTYTQTEIYIWRWRNSFAVTKEDIKRHRYINRATPNEPYVQHLELRLKNGEKIKSIRANKKRKEEFLKWFNPKWEPKLSKKEQYKRNAVGRML